MMTEFEPEIKKSLAEFLKEKRQNKRLTLDRLSDLTKIQIYHLEALEAGQFDKLPPSIYRAGIFNRLAKFLDIDNNEIIELYNAEARAAIMTFASDKPVAKLKKNPYFILTPKKLAIFSGGLLLVLLIAYLWYQFNFLVGPPNLAINPKEDMIVKQESFTVDGKTDSGVGLTINGENVFISPNGDFSKNIQLAAGLNIIEIKAVNNFGKTAKVVRQIFREKTE